MEICIFHTAVFKFPHLAVKNKCSSLSPLHPLFLLNQKLFSKD